MVDANMVLKKERLRRCRNWAGKRLLMPSFELVQENPFKRGTLRIQKKENRLLEIITHEEAYSYRRRKRRRYS
jgi:hypothetical protein